MRYALRRNRQKRIRSIEKGNYNYFTRRSRFARKNEWQVKESPINKKTLVAYAGTGQGYASRGLKKLFGLK